MSSLDEAIRDSNVQGAVGRMLSLLRSDSEIDNLKNLQEFLVKCNAHVCELVNAALQSSVVSQCDDLGELVVNISQASFVDPRGKYDVSIKEKGIYLDGKSGGHVVEWANVDTSICLPSPTSAKKEGERLLFLVLKEPMQVKGKKVSIVSWTLSNGGKDLRAVVGPIHFCGA